MTDQPTQPEPPEPPQPDATPGGAGAWLFGALIGAFIVGLIVVAWLAGKDEGKREAGQKGPTQTTRTAPAPTPSVAATGPGKQLFVAKCATCHTLKGADAKGGAGPNLDDLRPDAAQVLAALENGGAGSGAMPAGLYAGKQAQQVADYVAAAGGGG